MIIDERMSAFIDSLDSGNPAWLNEIEKYALDTQVPIIRRSMQSLLKFFTDIHKAEEHPGSRDCYRLFCVTYE